MQPERPSSGTKHKEVTEMIMMAISSPPAEAGTARDPPVWRPTAPLKRWWVAYMTWRIEQFAITRLRALSDRDRELGNMGQHADTSRHAVGGGLAAS